MAHSTASTEHVLPTVAPQKVDTSALWHAVGGAAGGMDSRVAIKWNAPAPGPAATKASEDVARRAVLNSTAVPSVEMPAQGDRQPSTNKSHTQPDAQQHVAEVFFIGTSRDPPSSVVPPSATAVPVSRATSLASVASKCLASECGGTEGGPLRSDGSCGRLEALPLPATPEEFPTLSP